MGTTGKKLLADDFIGLFTNDKIGMAHPGDFNIFHVVDPRRDVEEC